MKKWMPWLIVAAALAAGIWAAFGLGGGKPGGRDAGGRFGGHRAGACACRSNQAFAGAGASAFGSGGWRRCTIESA